ncbi:MAG: histidine--tRNA ligase [Bacteroidota bacterium]|nr:histidine--tRNA ligase [Bacteroidota bacterium]
MAKPSLPQGTRDFNAETVRKRNYIFNTIRSVFEVYGFQPLETPAMENLDTLMGKYGDEGDKLIFKILNNGLDNVAKHQQIKDDFEKVLIGKNTKGITERALRYDLTIPFARYVAMNHGQLTFPFKRYQIQPVWRADRPQRGRYREFYQCDCDVVGSYSLINEVELATIYATAFEKLGIDVEIKINSRKILAALAELCGGADKMIDITIAIDKLDKIGIEKVKDELLQRGLNDSQISIIEKYLSIDGDTFQKLSAAENLFQNNATAKKGLEEIYFLINYSQQSQISNLKSQINIDFTLARGLNYYTGIIFEVKAKNVNMGSIGGGGRYDDLTGTFDVPNIPGVGISFGVDRIYDVMEELKLFPAEMQTATQVLFFNLGEAESRAAFGLMQQLRAKNIRCEIYHEQAKFDKQFKWADKKQIPYAVIMGSTELENGTCTLKNLKEGVQEILTNEQLLAFEF